MNKKKILYILLLILVIAAVVVIVIVTNNKTANTDQNTDTNNISVNSLMGGTSIAYNEKPSEAKIESNKQKPILEITDQIFINQITDIYIDRENYEGRQVKLEGFLMIIEYEGETMYNVLRQTPGCCGDDGYAGLEFTYDKEYPSENDWLAIEGTIEYYEDGPNIYPILRVSKLEVKQTRGKDFLEQ